MRSQRVKRSKKQVEVKVNKRQVEVKVKKKQKTEDLLSSALSLKPSAFSLFSVLWLLFSVFCLLCLFTGTVIASEKWPGVDESVVEKYAKEHGREAKEPFINTDQGDLLLFVFLLAGAAGGFIAGYYWRILTGERPKDREPRTQTKEAEDVTSRSLP